ncbi:hypothetical protein QBC32DRAFT_336669 [Pseudoneurospora amorphoporcata]|uniref:Rhodanese domain-containing protein n=1 Tax=Pseudoneurospora amorphoporcata TaxID=241081 RepID=A0AAN6P091_9PEZI|nr:hypothetical protein QBC32DRAFT_336669 [Pseudoneurospora amorphoporcata]
MTTIGSLQRLSAPALSKLILAEQEASAAPASTENGSPTSLAIIDVRDDDYIGGHIKGSQNVPSHKLDAMLPTLVRQLQDKETVVFHCALSQQRGPSAALRYIRERERLMPKEVGTKLTSTADRAAVEEVAEEVAKEADGAEKKEEEKKPVNQKVFVLDRGFVGWQEAFGLDERLTEGYRKELWKDGYWM